MSTITIYAFDWVPPFARGLVRDLRVRWALEEAGLAYQQRLISQAEKGSDPYLALQPFGQVPAYREDGLELFESGAIVLHIAERSEALMPREPAGRARTTAWMFAALNSIEPCISALIEIDLFHADAAWARMRRPDAEAAVRSRLGQLARWLDGCDFLEGRFTAGDLMMTTVLRILRHTELVSEFPALAGYQQRCEARPAFQRALEAHLAPYAAAEAEPA